MLDHALEYARAGLFILPCEETVVGIKDSGKQPIGELVAHGCNSASCDEQVIRRWWGLRPNANIAIATGQSGLVVVDIDDREGKLGSESWQEVQPEPAPDTLEVITGSGGRHLYYGGARSSGNNIRSGLDVKSLGGYVLAPPSLHFSGRRYEWEGCEFDPSIIVPAPEWIVSLGRAARSLPAQASAILPTREIDEIRSALCFVSADDYDTWVQVGMALASTHAGHQALGLWHEWSSKSTKYDSRATEKKWQSFDPFGSVQMGTLFHLAKANGWSPPPPPVVEVPSPRTIKAPDQMEPPEGILRDMYLHCLETARRRQPSNALATAICFGAVCCGRLYCGETGLRTNIQVLNVIDASGGKDHGRKVLLDALSLAGLRENVGGKPASDSALYVHMASQPLKLYMLDEFGIIMQQAAAEGQGGHSSRMLRALMEAFTSADSPLWAGPEYADKKNNTTPIVEYPCLVLLATSTPETFYPALKSVHAASGFLPRFLVFEDKGVPAKQHRPAREIPGHIIRWAQEIRAPQRHERMGNLVGVSPATPYIVPRLPEAGSILLDFDADCDTRIRMVKDSTRHLWGRGGEIADKLATIAACAVGSVAPVVRTEHAEWAVTTTRQQIEWMAGTVGARVANTEYQGRRQEVLEIVRAAGGITRCDLDRHPVLSQWQRRERTQILEDLVASELIAEATIPKKGPGRPGSGYVVVDEEK